MSKSRKPRQRPRIWSKLARWKNDVDYWDQLTPQQKVWLSRTMEELYGGDPRPKAKKKIKKKSHADYRAARNDVMSRHHRRTDLSESDSVNPTPEEVLLAKEEQEAETIQQLLSDHTQVPEEDGTLPPNGDGGVPSNPNSQDESIKENKCPIKPKNQSRKPKKRKARRATPNFRKRSSSSQQPSR